ncbi:MAG: acetylglutamate kinase [Spirochaetales bacterium]
MNIIVIKIGGLVAQDGQVLAALLEELAQAGSTSRGPDFVLVHGGGKEVTAVSQKFGYEAEFRDGIRITSPSELEVVDMVLGGKLNIDLVRRAQAAGLDAVGLGGQDGHIFTGEALPVADRPDSRTGKVSATDSRLLETLLEGGFLPILHSTSMDSEGRGLNINADEVAQEVAIALRARTLLFLSDIPGVLKDGAVLKQLDRAQAEAEIEAGAITGGMIPKVNNALAACERGVGEVLIGGYRGSGDLARLLAHQAGTAITE